MKDPKVPAAAKRSCKAHPRYKARLAPKAPCLDCRAMWAVSPHRLKRRPESYEVAPGPAVLEVGTILLYTWGHGQTNRDFFRVESRTKKTVKIREIGSYDVDRRGKGGPRDCGIMIPVVTATIGEPALLTKRVTKLVSDQREVEGLSMDHGVARPIDPRSAFFASWWY